MITEHSEAWPQDVVILLLHVRNLRLRGQATYPRVISVRGRVRIQIQPVLHYWARRREAAIKEGFMEGYIYLLKWSRAR